MHSIDKRAEARRLFVESSMTHEQASRTARVSLSTVKEWSRIGGWMKAREDYRREDESLSNTIAQAKKLVIEKLLKIFDGRETFDSQAVYAAVKTGMLLMIFQVDAGKGDSKAVIEFLESLLDNDERVARILKAFRRAVAA